MQKSSDDLRPNPEKKTGTSMIKGDNTPGWSVQSPPTQQDQQEATGHLVVAIPFNFL